MLRRLGLWAGTVATREDFSPDCGGVLCNSLLGTEGGGGKGTRGDTGEDDKGRGQEEAQQADS